MSVKLDPKEILEYLNELGYCNISAEQLKEFVKDLKKLIKYDVKKGSKENYVEIPCRKNKSQPEIRSSNICESSRCYGNQSRRPITRDFPTENRQYVNKFGDEIFTNLHSASTVSSRAKSVIPNVSFAPKKDAELGSVQSSYYTVSDSWRGESVPRSKSATTRPKSFIRPPLSLHSSKSDPVSLYHRYQEDWKKHKMPGEDSHKKLRWAIREKMLSGPDILPMPVSRKVRL